ncbi:MAG TPA: hypothetical protein P5320_07785 [Bacteroidales bacterium]|nr:hypothetical protein [Bacteroidales bacterium]HOK75603.1 hypothetical protein [Bacteroidales bacterium]HOU30672.1 hypothetical protein [Bacteroidales bacterium]HPP93566.1 hypothetical protein [Bacteroidales bacterium]HQG55699.1 hypothetical protein [Bacteroidales bacterium]
MKSKYLSLILEIVWIIAGVLTFVSGINQMLSDNWKRALLFFAMSVVSFAFARFRHSQRKKL